MKKLLTRLALLMILCAELALPVFADAETSIPGAAIPPT